MARHTGKIRFRCCVCDKRFAWRHELKSHRCTDKSLQSQSERPAGDLAVDGGSDSDDKTSDSSETETETREPPSVSISDRKSFICPECGKMFCGDRLTHGGPSGHGALGSQRLASTILQLNTSWVEVVGRGKRAPGCAASPPRLSLSNPYSALASDGDPDTGSAGTGTDGSASSSLAPVVDRSAAAAGPNHRLPSQTSASAARQRLLKEAVRRHSGGLLSQSRNGAAPARPGQLSHRSSCPPPPGSRSMDRPPASREPPNPHPVPLHPLFPPSTVLFGNSIIRNIRFFNATTHCFPGATVPVILDKLPELLHSLSSSINRLIFHLGSNDTARRQSEQTKMDFVALFNL
ncbi:hypothetical protein ABVT39_003500 [Epinephelus coioides]